MHDLQFSIRSVMLNVQPVYWYTFIVNTCPKNHNNIMYKAISETDCILCNKNHFYTKYNYIFDLYTYNYSYMYTNIISYTLSGINFFYTQLYSLSI